ncbi:MAG: ABC transporter ATP-binding protein [Ardenticatenaceae bacterium]|nr:ABC transporter ATP-binding protein [Ardenticatenaceae bacterium]
MLQNNLVIQVNGLEKQYQMGDNVVHALCAVTFTVQRGEFIALMGPSGSGKSTLMHLLGCLDTPTAGDYRLNGRLVSQLSQRERAVVRNREIGFVFQTFNLLPRLTALENVLLPLLYSGRISAGRARSQSEQALTRVGLTERIHHKPTEMSGGQRQRVAIARALVNDPALILADEPTGNLDSRTGETIMALLGELNDDDRTIILVTHDPDVAAAAERTLHMKDGQIT